jgi:hypothetical protein
MYLGNDPFKFIHELRMKVMDGHEPTQEEIDECMRIMGILTDALRPVFGAWLDALNAFVNEVIEMMDLLPEEIQECLKMYGTPIIVPESGVEQKEPEPEKPMGHPHTAFRGADQYIFIPADYTPYYARFTTMDMDFKTVPPETFSLITGQSGLDEGTES